MRVYTLNERWGYYLGRFFKPTWTDRPSLVGAIAAPDIRGIERNILDGYYRYLHRLGQHTFGLGAVPLWSLPEITIDIEHFADFHILKLWPKYGRLWQVVGAASNPFSELQVHERIRGFPLHQETGTRPLNDVILRYESALWWGRVIAIGRDGRWYIMMYREIGNCLMFERRGIGKAKRYKDSWDFGMSCWEVRGIAGRKHLYLWGGADVTYVGMATRLRSTIFSVRELKP